MAAITSSNPRDHLLPNSIDMSTLSHSELHSLSLLSHNSPLSIPHDVISRAHTSPFFNESASSRRQTYSATPHHHHHHHRHRHISITLNERERSESVSIVRYLKRYLKSDGHNPATSPKSENVSVEILNRNGVVVDLAALEEREIGQGGAFEEELRRMTEGREKEEELLEVLGGIEGEWCSRRKKRRIVDACLLGDALPVGWKVIIALRRKGGHFSPYCRSYISPTGEHLSSCKEVSSYLKSYLGINDTELLRDSRGEPQELQRVDLNNLHCLNSEDDTSMVDVFYATTSNTCLSVVAHEKDVSISGIENLPDVQVSDHYECHSCNMSFDVKGNYLQHMLSTHERTTKRYKLGSSVGDKVAIRDGNYECHTCNINFDIKERYLEHLLSTHKRKPKKRRLVSSVTDGVIIRDGKYECQFCDKVFEEKRRYIGHVGNHVKGSIKSTKGSVFQVSGTAKAPHVDRLPTMIGNSKMDALIEIAQNSIQDISPSVPEKGPSCINIIDQFCIARSSNIRNADFVPEKNSSFCIAELGMEKSGVGKALSSQLNPCSKVSRTSNFFLRETGKDNGKDKTMLKESRPPFDKTSEILMKDGDIIDSLTSLDKNEMEKDGANISTKVLYSCDKMKENTITNGTTNGSASCQSYLEVEKDGEEKTSSKLKEQAFARTFVDCEYESCFDAMTTPVVDTGIQGGSSTSNWLVKSTDSTPTNDDGSAEESEGGLKISFLSYNQKAPDIDSAVEKIQTKNMDKHEPELAQRHNNDDLAGDARAFGCTTLLNSSSPFDEIFEKAEQNICSLDPNLESGNGFDEYMKLDEIEPQMYKYNAMSGGDSIFLPEVSMDLENDTEFDLARFNASANPQSEFPEAIASRSASIMICVWCGSEFSHEVVELEPQPDSVGFMCPGCRAKISKQFNELESNFSVNPHYS